MGIFVSPAAQKSTGATGYQGLSRQGNAGSKGFRGLRKRKASMLNMQDPRLAETPGPEWANKIFNLRS
jgi:hypothetical protein